MSSIFDLLFGGQQAYNPAGGATPPFNPNGQQRTPSILDSPEYGQQRMNDALTGMAQALIAAGAPSAQPRGFLDAFGAAGAGALGGMQNSEDRFLKRTMINSQVRKNQQEMDNDKAWREMFNAGGVAPSTPVTQTASPAASGGYYAKTGSSESGNNPSIMNAKGSGAGGTYQFMPQTWADVATKNPQLGLPFDMRAALPQPGDTPEVTQKKTAWQQAAMEALTRQNAEELKTAGFDPTSANLYYAHRFGPKGASTFLGADPNAQIAKLFPDWIAQNPDLNTTVGAFRQNVDKQYANVPSPVQPAVAQGDASGNPVQPVQYQPPQARTMQEVVAGLPPGMRQMIGAMGRKEGMAALMKYGFVTPIEAQRLQMDEERLGMDRERFGMDKDKARRDAANAKIVVGPDDKPSVNPTVLEYEKRLKAMEDEFKQGEEKRKREAGQSEKTFGQEKQVRQEYETQPAVKSYRVVVPMMEAAAKAGPTRAGDLNLVYAFAKLMDPDSVVRESETAGVQATGNLGDRVMGYVGMLNGNPTLSPETRAKLMDELQTRFTALKESNDVLAAQYTDIANAYGLDPSRVVIPIRKAGVGKTAEGNQPSQDELKGWASGAQTGGVRLQYVPGKGVVPR